MPTALIAEDLPRCASHVPDRWTALHWSHCPGGWLAFRYIFLATILTALCSPPARAAADLFDRTIEELGELRVTSVSRRSEPMKETASAIYVITAEDIRRSGYNSIPEILRLAPGVEVAREGAHSWTISIRGFNSDLSNKLLVLIDGRSVYSPLYAGVFWDAQDTLLQDIERIEVISGPGGTMWGANAVNGVINIITRSATETNGFLMELGTGDEQQAVIGLRHGWSLSKDLATRVYAKYSEHEPSLQMSGDNGVDESRTARAGFRMDWERDNNTDVTLQGDVYTSELGAFLPGSFTLGTLPGPEFEGDVDIAGHNLLARWLHRLDGDATLQFQGYYDHTARDIPNIFDERRDTLDLDFQHQFRYGTRHNIIWGAGFRLTSDRLKNTIFAAFVPDERTDRTYSLFAQDEIALIPDRLFLTVGTKLQKNDYTDFELQPNLRINWMASERQSLWAAVSHAVRIPARLNTDLRLTVPVSVPGLPVPLYVNVSGNENFRSEDLTATEVGYRFGISQDLSLDVSLFYNQYDNLQTQEAGPISAVGDPPEYLLLPATLQNGMEGDTSGGSLVVNWQPLAAWRLQFQYDYLDMDLSLKPGATDTGALGIAGNSPSNQAALHSFLALPYDLEFFTSIRYTHELPSFDIPDRTAVDLSLGWRPAVNLRTSLTVRNLTDDTHLEFGGANLIERSVYLRAVWTF